MAEQTRGEYAGVVDDKEIARTQPRRKIRDTAVMSRTGTAVEYKEPRGTARLRILRDQLIRQVEHEVGDVQGMPSLDW
jgi:hypothetical protein